MDTFRPFSNVCSPGSSYKFWLGIKDEIDEGFWVNADTKETVVYDNFQPPFPNGGLLYNCVLMLESGTWADVDCESKHCAACRMDRSDFVYLRGLCYDHEYRTHFRVNGYVDGRPFFHGYFDHIVEWDRANHRWLLKDITDNRTLAWLKLKNEKKYPLGAYDWTMTEDMCGVTGQSSVPLSLSSCAHDLFMCKSGQCIDHMYRCNLQDNCVDGSDEDNCNMVAVNSGYRRHLPPRGLNNTALKLFPSLMLTRIATVDDINMALVLEFQLAQTWLDDRIYFRHLHVANKTLIPEREVKKIWTPRFQLLNVEGGQSELFDTKVFVYTARNATVPDFNNVVRGK